MVSSFIPDGYIRLTVAVDAVGRQTMGVEWTGDECVARTPEERELDVRWMLNVHRVNSAATARAQNPLQPVTNVSSRTLPQPAARTLEMPKMSDSDRARYDWIRAGLGAEAKKDEEGALARRQSAYMKLRQLLWRRAVATWVLDGGRLYRMIEAEALWGDDKKAEAAFRRGRWSTVHGDPHSLTHRFTGEVVIEQAELDAALGAMADIRADTAPASQETAALPHQANAPPAPTAALEYRRGPKKRDASHFVALIIEQKPKDGTMIDAARQVIAECKEKARREDKRWWLVHDGHEYPYTGTDKNCAETLARICNKQAKQQAR
jgi:hypothetical protein